MTTDIPSYFTSERSAFEKPAIANLEAQYVVRQPDPTIPAIELTLIICPLLLVNYGKNALIKAICDKKFVFSKVSALS